MNDVIIIKITNIVLFPHDNIFTLNSWWLLKDDTNYEIYLVLLTIIK